MDTKSPDQNVTFMQRWPFGAQMSNIGTSKNPLKIDIRNISYRIISHSGSTSPSNKIPFFRKSDIFILKIFMRGSKSLVDNGRCPPVSYIILFVVVIIRVNFYYNYEKFPPQKKKITHEYPRFAHCVSV